MKKYKSSLLIFIIISLSLCGCSNQEVSNLCDVYEGETVDLSEIYSKNKDEATRLFNFYYNYGKHVESKDYKNYNCYTYDNTPAQSRPTFPYRNMVDIVFGNASYFLASDYSSLNSANYYYDSFHKDNTVTIWKKYKNIIYCESIIAYFILFGTPKQENGDYYLLEENEKILLGFTEEKYHQVSNVKFDEGYSRTYGEVFMSNRNITSLETNDDLLAIGFSSFVDCINLTKVILNDNLREIREGAFSYCTSLSEINFPQSVRKIYYKAFYGCESLESVIIPKNVALVGDMAFNFGNVFCEVKEKPESWSSDFAVENAKVYWADEWKYDENNNPVPLVEK